MEMPELQSIRKKYQAERQAVGSTGPNDVILQIAAYVADTAEKAYAEPEASTMRQRRMVRQTLHHTGDQEAFERLRRLAEASYDEVLQRVAYGTPEAVVDRLQEYRETLGITGVSLDAASGGPVGLRLRRGGGRQLSHQPPRIRSRRDGQTRAHWLDRPPIHLTPLRQNAANLPSCSAIWQIPPASPANSTPRICV